MGNYHPLTGFSPQISTNTQKKDKGQNNGSQIASLGSRPEVEHNSDMYKAGNCQILPPLHPCGSNVSSPGGKATNPVSLRHRRPVAAIGKDQKISMYLWWRIVTTLGLYL